MADGSNMESCYFSNLLPGHTICVHCHDKALLVGWYVASITWHGDKKRGGKDSTEKVDDAHG